MFRTAASVEHQVKYDHVTESAAAARLRELRRIALETTEDDLNVNPVEWSDLSQHELSMLGSIEKALNDELRVAAPQKFNATQRA